MKLNMKPQEYEFDWNKCDKCRATSPEDGKLCRIRFMNIVSLELRPDWCPRMGMVKKAKNG